MILSTFNVGNLVLQVPLEINSALFPPHRCHHSWETEGVKDLPKVGSGERAEWCRRGAGLTPHALSASGFSSGQG